MTLPASAPTTVVETESVVELPVIRMTPADFAYVVGAWLERLGADPRLTLEQYLREALVEASHR